MKYINILEYGLLKVVAILLLLLVTACSSTSGPVVIRESSTSVVKQQDDGKLGSDNKQAMVQPVAPDKAINIIPIVEKLIVQSNREINNRNYDQAINLAERGLRINRKEPRLYLALAKAYRGEGNAQQSVYFARQGLRYTPRNSDVYQELSGLSK